MTPDNQGIAVPLLFLIVFPFFLVLFSVALTLIWEAWKDRRR
jgi:hypothetical protein